MYCPQCGSTQSDELRFCKTCGANLEIVRASVTAGTVPGKFDWSKTWVAEMLQSSDQWVRKEKERERHKETTPETRRRNEIKAGVITASVGVGVMITVFMIMQGIIAGGFVPQAVAEILSRVWISGVIPLMVGLALIINGVFVNKMFSGSEKLREQQRAIETGELAGKPSEEYLPPADTRQLFPAGFSVTDETTRHLKETIERERKSR